MITAEPDITRLLARLKAQKLIRQQRDKRDRRVLWTQISASGLELLAQMDEEVQQFPKELLAHLSEDEIASFIRLLELARQTCTDTQAPVSCDGSQRPGGEPCPAAAGSANEENRTPTAQDHAH